MPTSAVTWQYMLTLVVFPLLATSTVLIGFFMKRLISRNDEALDGFKTIVSQLSVRLERVTVASEALNDRLERVGLDMLGFTKEVKDVYSKTLVLEEKIKQLERDSRK